MLQAVSGMQRREFMLSRTKVNLHRALTALDGILRLKVLAPTDSGP